MQRLIRPTFPYLLVVFVMFGCKTPRYNTQNEYINRTLDTTSEEDVKYIQNLSNGVKMDSIRVNTSDFYDIEVCSKPNRKVFNLSEQKFFSIKITNYGTKTLYLPEWFRRNKNFSNVEMIVEIYKEEKGNYENYIQKKMKTNILVQGAINIKKREVFEISKGEHVLYEDIWIDMYKKIVDEGSYKAKVYIDLSSFGFFKVLESEFSFDVK